jgi:hypothetical protein
VSPSSDSILVLRPWKESHGTTALDASHPLPAKLPPAPSNLYKPAQSACSRRRLELLGVHKYRATQFCTVASNTFGALSVGLTSCQPSDAQNIEVAYRFLKTLWPPGYCEHSCEQSALETARKFGGDGSVLGGG